MRTNLFPKYTKAFIETGSFVGDGIDLALRSGFSEVYFIELAENYFQHCQRRFDGDERVYLILGDSFYELEKLLNSFPQTPFTYWLDGHYSGDDTGFGVQESPLLKELEVIFQRKVSGEWIFVDDMRLYRNFNKELNLETIHNLMQKYIPHGQFLWESSPHDPQDILVITT